METEPIPVAVVGVYLPLAGGTMTGDIELGANKLKTTNLLLKEVDADTLGVRNSADTLDKSIRVISLLVYSTVIGADALFSVNTQDVNGAAVGFGARDTDVGMRTIGGIKGAAEPYMYFGDSEEFKFQWDGKMGLFGATPVAQQTKAGHNNWAAVGDVVNALVSLGLFDAA